ncbi:hypothetical protein [Spiroplasma endosymbiont of Stenodema calcarata]|uniref:hypothetical protein n=1 Tax=Spiroplasma endosymbiont of Stenodema calcarata TaxID=3139328 RepID=UPI003CCAC0EA
MIFLFHQEFSTKLKKFNYIFSFSCAIINDYILNNKHIGGGTMEANYKKSLRKVRQYNYTFFKVLLVILLFPLVLLLSFICSKVFVPYLFKYKRSGVDQNNVELNTLQQLETDVKAKKLKDFVINKRDLEESFIKFNNKEISTLMLEHPTST